MIGLRQNRRVHPDRVEAHKHDLPSNAPLSSIIAILPPKIQSKYRGVAQVLINLFD
jgi:hypothetical protein